MKDINSEACEQTNNVVGRYKHAVHHMSRPMYRYFHLKLSDSYDRRLLMRHHHPELRPKRRNVAIKGAYPDPGNPSINMDDVVTYFDLVKFKVEYERPGSELHAIAHAPAPSKPLRADRMEKRDELRTWALKNVATKRPFASSGPEAI